MSEATARYPVILLSASRSAVIFNRTVLPGPVFPECRSTMFIGEDCAGIFQ